MTDNLPPPPPGAPGPAAAPVTVPLWKRKLWKIPVWAIAAAVLIIVIAAIAGGGKDDEKSVGPETTSSTTESTAAETTASTTESTAAESTTADSTTADSSPDATETAVTPADSSPTTEGESAEGGEPVVVAGFTNYDAIGESWSSVGIVLTGLSGGSQELTVTLLDAAGTPLSTNTEYVGSDRDGGEVLVSSSFSDNVPTVASVRVDVINASSFVDEAPFPVTVASYEFDGNFFTVKGTATNDRSANIEFASIDCVAFKAGVPVAGLSTSTSTMVPGAQVAFEATGTFDPQADEVRCQGEASDSSPTTEGESAEGGEPVVVAGFTNYDAIGETWASVGIVLTGLSGGSQELTVTLLDAAGTPLSTNTEYVGSDRDGGEVLVSSSFSDNVPTVAGVRVDVINASSFVDEAPFPVTVSSYEFDGNFFTVKGTATNDRSANIEFGSIDCVAFKAGVPIAGLATYTDTMVPGAQVAFEATGTFDPQADEVRCQGEASS